MGYPTTWALLKPMVASLHSHNYGIFRELLIKARKEAELTQAEVAQELEVPQSFVSKYESGERRLDFTEFMKLADLLKIDIASFIANYKNLTN